MQSTTTQEATVYETRSQRFLIAAPSDTTQATATAPTRQAARRAMVELSKETGRSFRMFGPLAGDVQDNSIPVDVARAFLGLEV